MVGQQLCFSLVYRLWLMCSHRIWLVVSSAAEEHIRLIEKEKKIWIKRTFLSLCNLIACSTVKWNGMEWLQRTDVGGPPRLHILRKHSFLVQWTASCAWTEVLHCKDWRVKRSGCWQIHIMQETAYLHSQTDWGCWSVGIVNGKKIISRGWKIVWLCWLAGVSSGHFKSFSCYFDWQHSSHCF